MSSDEEERSISESFAASDEDSSSDQEPDVPESKSVYNRAALLQKLNEIKLPDDLPWVHTQTINSGFTHEGINAEDDFNREVSFYKQALAGCIEARVKMEALGIKYKRPEDYFAEMVKSDSHMSKVRQSLLDQQKRIEAVEERRRQRELKRFGKTVQVEKEQARAKQKKEQIESIKKWRKDKQNKTLQSTEDISVLLDDEVKSDAPKKQKSQQQPQQSNQTTARKNLKRQRKDDKYGYGGRQKRAKRNTTDSTDDVRSFNVRNNKSVAPEFISLTPGFGAGKGPKNRGSKGPANTKRVKRK